MGARTCCLSLHNWSNLFFGDIKYKHYLSVQDTNCQLKASLQYNDMVNSSMWCTLKL